MYKLMHRVRAYTFDFCSFLYVAYTTLHKMFAVFYVLLFRIRRPFIAHKHNTRALHVPVGDIGPPVLRACRSSLLQRSSQCSGKRRHQGWDDVVQSEREVTVSTQSQVSSTVPTVSWCTGRMWTATCPQLYYWPTTRFVFTSSMIYQVSTQLKTSSGE